MSNIDVLLRLYSRSARFTASDIVRGASRAELRHARLLVAPHDASILCGHFTIAAFGLDVPGVAVLVALRNASELEVAVVAGLLSFEPWCAVFRKDTARALRPPRILALAVIALKLRKERAVRLPIALAVVAAKAARLLDSGHLSIFLLKLFFSP